jgi:hypothetical protein
MKMKILALVAVGLTAGGISGFSQQPLVQTAQTYPWINCPWRNVSGAAYTYYDSKNATWYHGYYGRVYHYSNYGCCN